MRRLQSTKERQQEMTDEALLQKRMREEMDKQEREKLIKEARLAAISDMQLALARMMDKLGANDASRETAKFIAHYLTEIAGEVTEDKVGRVRL
jgi:predicted nucleic acid-binding protein